MTLDKISAIAAITTFIIMVIWKTIAGKPLILSDIVIAVLAAGMLPLAVGFILYPFYPKFIGSMKNKELQIVLTGIVLLFVYGETIFEKLF